jgi:hypothetical protein
MIEFDNSYGTLKLSKLSSFKTETVELNGIAIQLADSEWRIPL